jgi:hypothetical protein
MHSHHNLPSDGDATSPSLCREGLGAYFGELKMYLMCRADRAGLRLKVGAYNLSQVYGQSLNRNQR